MFSWINGYLAARLRDVYFAVVSTNYLISFNQLSFGCVTSP